MSGASIEIVGEIHECLKTLEKIIGVVHPDGYFATLVPGMLDKAMHKQQEEMIATQGKGTWAQLSEWRLRDREKAGTGTAMLDATGRFKALVGGFTGMWSATPESFQYIYPGFAQGEGYKQYFGIAGGQKINPLARIKKERGGGYKKRSVRPRPIPMKNVPRPILFGTERLAIDVASVMREFLAEVGFIGFGITGFGGEEL